LKTKLKHYLSLLPGLFIVSQVEFLSAGAGNYRSELIPSLEVTIQKADGKKCERCWNYSTHVGENARYPAVCERCTAALAEIEGSTGHASSGA
jgi:isoleucyl-tRNA synthetase